MNKISSLQLRLRSFGYAFKGLFVAFQSQANLQLHGLAAILVTLLGLYVGLNAIEWCIILLCIALVIGAELINTAIETYIDYKSPEQHPEIGKAKDVAAAAVLVCAIVAVIVGCIIFIPKFL
jgi:diacylglycerol kinase (ATP)